MDNTCDIWKDWRINSSKERHCKTDKMTIKQRFKSAIKRGTGEAHLIMMENPNTDFSSDIIKAALTNYAYDSQSEGSRADYIFELIELSNQKERIKRKILDKLQNEREDSWTLDQLFDLAALFAKQGDKEAHKAIYKRFYKKRIPASEWVGQDAILELDGLEGLKYIAETKGKIIDNNSEEWEDSFMIDFFQEENPQIKVYEELEKAATSNNYIKVYLEAIKKNKFERLEREKPVYDYKMVTERIENNVIVPLPPAYIKDLSNSDIKRLAEDFLKSKTRVKQEKYLRVFDKVKYPFDFKDLLSHAKRPYSSNDRLVEYAVNSLRFFTNNEIRNFALEILNSNAPRPDIYTNLLIANYKVGDGRLLSKIVNKAKTEHQVHDLAFSYVDIFQANKTTDCEQPLLALYNKLTCSLHREDIVRIMIENNVLPDSIRKEIKYDSLLSTRELVKENE
jgi:hypothetical protein